MASNLVRFRKYLSKFFDAGFLFSNAFVPLVVLTLYFVLFSYLLPEGVNKVFAGESWKLSLGLAGVAGLLVFVLWRLKGKFSLQKSTEKLSAQDFIPLFLPLAVVVQYILSNQDILSIRNSLLVVGIFIFFSAIFIVVVPRFFRATGSTRTLTVLGLSFAFTFIDMAAISRQLNWFDIGSLKIQLAVFGSLFLLVWFLYDFGFKKLVYLLILVYFVSNSLVQAVAPHENVVGSGTTSFSDNKLVELIGGRKPKSTPNVYLLIYDAYAHNETMLSYGIDNSLQEKYLKGLGFKLYPQIYSIGAASLNTMSRVFNASTEYYGNIRRAASGDGVVQNLLKGLGYKTYGLFPSDYFFRGYGSHYDSYFPTNITPPGNLLWEAVLMGEFKFDLEFDKVPHEQFVEEKLNVFKEIPETPRFIDMHTNIPNHSQNSGSCLPNETELYKERLDRANLEMRQDLETLIKSDPSAIIIVASDHGPYLTKNCTLTEKRYDISEITRLDIQDRFGTFLAIRWPTKDFEAYDDITVLQDLFPSIFSYLYKDKNLLQSKVESSTLDLDRISGASVKNGIIYGGINDGDPLFVK